MIYLVREHNDFMEHKVVTSVWDVDHQDAERAYKEYMLGEAEEINLVINPHWLNVMDYINNNSHLDFDDYLAKKSFFQKFRERNPIDKFLENIGGRRLKYIEV